MKQINFNQKEILSALLNKTKTVFIVKAFRECQGCYKCEYLRGDGECEHEPKYYYDRPCEYKEGEIYEVEVRL